MMYSFRNCSFFTPFSMEPQAYGVFGQSKGNFPLCDGHAFTVMRDDAVVSFVAALRFLIAPFNVLWGVIATVFLSVKAVLWGWLYPHIGDKGREVILPGVTYRHSSASVVFERFILWVVAPFSHALPCAVEWMLAARDSINRLPDSSGRDFGFQAPTGLGASISDGGEPYFSGFAALALAENYPFFAASACEVWLYLIDNCQSSKLLTVLDLVFCGHGAR